MMNVDCWYKPAFDAILQPFAICVLPFSPPHSQHCGQVIQSKIIPPVNPLCVKVKSAKAGFHLMKV